MKDTLAKYHNATISSDLILMMRKHNIIAYFFSGHNDLRSYYRLNAINIKIHQGIGLVDVYAIWRIRAFCRMKICFGIKSYCKISPQDSVISTVELILNVPFTIFLSRVL